MLANGIPVRIVSERLRHSTVAFTMEIYQHALPGDQRKAAQNLRAVWTRGNAQQGAREARQARGPRASPAPSKRVADWPVSGLCGSRARGKVLQIGGSGGRTRTYDTRIMIPLL